MLCGQAVIAIWNGIAPETRDEFYRWHLQAHMPERVGIPGFRRGRRYRAADEGTAPEFFTLYEVDSFEILEGQDYRRRLDHPTPWTEKATAHFRDTARGLARVVMSVGLGSGGAMATLRFKVDGDGVEPPASLIHSATDVARLPQVTGIHVCKTDSRASTVVTLESKGRADIQGPPSWFVLIEACTIGALRDPISVIVHTDGVTSPGVGCYVHEYTRLKTDWAPG
jgi:hypothetical protein